MDCETVPPRARRQCSGPAPPSALSSMACSGLGPVGPALRAAGPSRSRRPAAGVHAGGSRRRRARPYRGCGVPRSPSPTRREPAGRQGLSSLSRPDRPSEPESARIYSSCLSLRPPGGAHQSDPSLSLSPYVSLLRGLQCGTGLAWGGGGGLSVTAHGGRLGLWRGARCQGRAVRATSYI